MPSPTPSRQIVSIGPAPHAPISPAVNAGGLIYVSGTAEAGDARIDPPRDIRGQTTSAIERISGLLGAAGSSLQQVVSVTVFLRAQSDFAAMNDAYKAFWPLDPPTRTTVVTELVNPAALIEMSMVALPNGVERTVIHPPGWSRSPSPYCYAIQAGDTLFLSGLVSRSGRDNAVVAGDVAVQTRVVLENAGEILHAAGMTYDHVVSAKVYLPDLAAFQEMNDAYRSFFGSRPPARATVGAALAGAQYNVEITLIASRSARQPVDDGRPPNPNLSAAIAAGTRVYVSGMLGNTEQTRRDAAAQTRETLARIAAALEAAGTSAANIADATVYLTDSADYAPMNDAYREFFGRDFPARTTVKSRLVAPEALVEIMATAVRT